MSSSARVLIVATSDSGGGAGIQADIKTTLALGGYATTAMVALTAQNTIGVQSIHALPTEFIAEQMRAVLDDIGADCIKIGMLHNTGAINTVTELLAELAPGVPVVVDPVMVAQSGDQLLADGAVDALRTRLLPMARVMTPNIPEAEVLLGQDINRRFEVENAAQELLRLGPEAVLLKGGHLEGDNVTDCLAIRGCATKTITYPRVATRNAHGTGCTLASAIATGIAGGLPLERAVRRARAYLQRALETAPDIGRGNGPVNHGYTVNSFDEE